MTKFPAPEGSKPPQLQPDTGVRGLHFVITQKCTQTNKKVKLEGMIPVFLLTTIMLLQCNGLFHF